MTLGTVKWFDESKGVGAILTEAGREASVHFSAIQGEGFRTLNKGEEVEFDLREMEGELHAANVMRH